MNFRALVLAHFFGIFCMIFSVIGAGFVGLISMFLVFLTDQFIEGAKNVTHLEGFSIGDKNYATFLTILWMGFMFGLVSLLENFASYNLIKATKPEVDSHEDCRYAIRSTKIGRCL